MKFTSILLAIGLTVNSGIQAFAEHIKVIVKEQKTACFSDQEQECLWVKLNNYKDWSTLYAPIEGFDYEEGYRYELLVDRTKAKGTNDINRHTYKLVKVVSRELVATPAHRSFDSIQNVKWYLTYFSEQDVSDQGLYMTLDGPASRILLFGGCNNYFGAFTVNYKTLNVGPVAGTMMACTNKMDLESRFRNAFSDNHLTYELSGNYLLFYRNGRHVMSFSRQPASREFDYLSSYDWALYKYDTTLMTISSLYSYITFDKNTSQIYGYDGCNHFSGHMEMFKNTMKFSGVTSTMKGCVDLIVNDIANHYARLLNTQNLTYTLENDRLMFYSGEKHLMTFQRKTKKTK